MSGSTEPLDEEQQELGGNEYKTASLNHFDTLPPELQLFFCDYLSYVDLCVASRVCRGWARIASDEYLWESKYRAMYKLSALSLKWKEKDDPMPWKNQFQKRTLLQRSWVEGKPNVMTLSGHTGTVTCLKYDNSTLISGSDDGSLILWELKFPSERRYSLMQQHHNNSKMTSRVNSFVGHGGPVWCLDMEGDTLVTGSYDKTVKLWSIKQAAAKCTLRGHDSWVSSIQINKNHVLSGSWDATLKLWEINENEHSGGSRVGSPVNSSSSSSSRNTPSPTRVGNEDAYSGRCVATLNGDVGDAVYCHQWETASNTVVMGCRHQVIHFWDLNTLTRTLTLQGHEKQVYSLQWDGNKVVSGSGDNTIRLWDPRTGACEAVLRGHNGPVMCLRYDSEYRMVSGSYDKSVMMWDLRLGRVLNTMHGHSSAVFCVQFDGEKIISGSSDKSVKIWDFQASVTAKCPGPRVHGASLSLGSTPPPSARPQSTSSSFKHALRWLEPKDFKKALQDLTRR